MPEPNDIPIELQTWLNVALLNLKGAAKDEVRSTIMRHYQDGLAAELQRGQSMQEAVKAVMATLGDPWTYHRPEPNNLPTGLQTWLNVALMNLKGKAKDEARDKVLGFYREELGAELQRGRKEQAARKAVMELLGDPWTYRAEHDLFPKLYQIKHIVLQMTHRTELDTRLADVVRWLTSAMPSMSEEDMERVCAELINHYQDAYADVMEAGRTDEEAHQIALSSLGNAVKVKHDLSHAYLSIPERDYLRVNLKLHSKVTFKSILLALGSSLIITLIILYMSAFTVKQASFFAFILSYSWIDGQLQVWIPAMIRDRTSSLRKTISFRIAWLPIIRIGMDILIVILLFRYLPGLSEKLSLYSLIIFGLMNTTVEILLEWRHLIPIWKKLRRGSVDMNPPRRDPDRYA